MNTIRKLWACAAALAAAQLATAEPAKDYAGRDLFADGDERPGDRLEKHAELTAIGVAERGRDEREHRDGAQNQKILTH